VKPSRLEHVTRRVLGAVRFVDGNTGLQVTGPLSIETSGARFVRNRRGCYVIWDAPSLENHAEAFEQPPGDPPLSSVTIELKVADPGNRYLPRRCAIRLPRDPDLQHVDEEESLFQPVDVRLLPSPTMGTAPGWAVVRATVVAEGTNEALPGALIRVLRTSDSELLAWGLSDWRDRAKGEAMVTVPGIPITTWGDGNGEGGNGPVIVNEIQVTLETFFDPDFEPAAGDLPDPEDLEARRAELPSSSTTVHLASGRTIAISLAVPLP
jgi:hypothetical protein